MEDPLQFLLIIIIIWLIAYIILEFNIVNDKKKCVDKSFNELDEILYKRLVIISKMLDIIKAYDKKQFDSFSSNLYDYLTNYTIFDINKKINLHEKIEIEIKKILLVSQVYPEILDNVRYIKYEKQLIRYNKRVLKLEIRYNRAVSIFFKRKKIFPSNLICNLLNFYQYNLINVNK